ncbi:hypothetical protein [Granulicoccus sp. GXG6511]|uniref:hypothetical protein n=1 Tax=Granulicoccus sp. GXG6511 TaxID=3381351 RepID=UPI003D7D9C9F
MIDGDIAPVDQRTRWEAAHVPLGRLPPEDLFSGLGVAISVPETFNFRRVVGAGGADLLL